MAKKTFKGTMKWVDVPRAQNEKVFCQQVFNRYKKGSRPYLPYWKGKTEESVLLLNNYSHSRITIYYNTTYAQEIYRGMFFGVYRQPKTTYHPKATTLWDEAYYRDNPYELENLYAKYINQNMEKWIRSGT